MLLRNIYNTLLHAKSHPLHVIKKLTNSKYYETLTNSKCYKTPV